MSPIAITLRTPLLRTTTSLHPLSLSEVLRSLLLANTYQDFLYADSRLRISDSPAAEATFFAPFVQLMQRVQSSWASHIGISHGLCMKTQILRSSMSSR